VPVALHRPAHRGLALLVGLTLTIALLLVSSESALASCAGAAARPDSTSRSQVRATTLCLLNDERHAAGLDDLKENKRLATAAERHAEDMADHRYFDHTSRDGDSFVDRIKRAGYLTGDEEHWTVGENLAWGSGELASPGRIVSAWMKSPGHRKNILSPSFHEIGLGMASADAGGSFPARTLYATEFGARRR
jgi:uncharacterized protein YkwD